MKTIPLGELIKPARVERAGNRDYPLLSMTMHGGLVDQNSKFTKRIASTDTSDYKVINSGQLVVGFPIDEGVLDFQTLYPKALVSPAYGVWDLCANERIDRPYMKRYLRSERAIAYYRAKLRGSTARRRSLPTDTFLALPVPLPAIAEQRRIAAILDQADTLRAKRRQVLTHVDTLTQSVFHDMFGSVSTSDWECVPLSSVVAAIENGTSKNCEARPATVDEWGILKLGAVTTGTFLSGENKAYLSNVGNMAINEVQLGDVLMTRKNTRELVGAVAIVDQTRPRLLLPDLIFRLRLDKHRLDPHYFQALMMNPAKRRRVQSLAGGSAGSMPNISKARLNGLPLELPPLALQQKFAERVRTASSQRETIERASADLDELFASLQSRAFRGEL